MNDDPDDDNAEARARGEAEVQGLLSKIMSDETRAMTAEVEELVATLRSKVGVGIWDTGCRKTLAGASWLHNYVQALASLGYPTEFAPCAEKLKFGNQGTHMSEKC